MLPPLVVLVILGESNGLFRVDVRVLRSMDGNEGSFFLSRGGSGQGEDREPFRSSVVG